MVFGCNDRAASFRILRSRALFCHSCAGVRSAQLLNATLGRGVRRPLSRLLNRKRSTFLTWRKCWS